MNSRFQPESGFSCESSAAPIDIEAGLAKEQWLLDQVATGQLDSGFLLWRSKPALVVPRSAKNRSGFEQACQASHEQGWPVVIRSTGGELTPQNEGFINLSMVVSCPKFSLNIRQSYLVICNAINGWLNSLGIEGYCSAIDGAFCDGEYNVVVDGRKLVGTAQRWKSYSVETEQGRSDRNAILMHGVIMCDGDLSRFWKVSNQFYRACGALPFIKDECHISLAELLNQQGEAFVTTMFNSLSEYMKDYMAELQLEGVERIPAK